METIVRFIFLGKPFYAIWFADKQIQEKSPINLQQTQFKNDFALLKVEYGD